MKIIRDGEMINRTAVALGNFDGIHKAHTEIINQCCNYAREKNLKSGVLLFDGHTLNVTENRAVNLITDKSEKLRVLEEAGLDFVYLREFTTDFMKLSPEQFADELIRMMNPSAVFVGYDYRFGYKAEGDTHILEKLGNEKGFKVIAVDEIKHNGTPVKSTEIRRLITEGNIAEANELLGRPFVISGQVEHGLQNGRKIGIPTVNVGYSADIILPKNGVYRGFTDYNGRLYKSVINVGNNPTLDAKKITVESHLLDFNEEIYGERVRVLFKDRIRDEKKFSGLEELKRQIHRDIAVTEGMD